MLLRSFISVIRALLTVILPVIERTEKTEIMGKMEKVERRERTEWTNNMNLTQLMTGIPIGEWKNTSQIKINQYNNDGKAVVDGENIIHEILKYSGSVVCGLIQGGLAPMRSVKIRVKIFV